MLVVHPASICDVCLDPYSITTEPANSPHAIACGHIFCLTCLRNLTPSACPLCRKSFQPERIKKLHVAGPPELDGASEEAENTQALSLLQRVALVSRENALDAEVVEVLTEVERWLSQHSEDPNSNLPLRAAVASLRRFKALQDQTEREKVEHRRLRHQLKHSRRNADHDLKTSRAVEESLLTRIQELEQDHALELSRLQAQLESLQNARNTHFQYRNTSNPLPQPPEPLPSHCLPPFLRPGGAADRPDPLLDAVPYASHPKKPNTNGSLPNGSYPVPPEPAGTSYTRVQIPQPVAPRPIRGEVPRVDQRSSPPSAQERQDRRSRSGSARNEFVDRPAPDSRRETSAGSRGSIVRTASPSTHVVIPSPRWSRQPLVEERRSDEERETAHRRGRSDGPISHRSVSGENMVPDMNTRMASAAAYIYGYGSGYNNGHRIASEPRPYTPSSHNAGYSRAQGSRGFPVQESPEGTNGLGLTGVPPRAPLGSVITASEDYDATPMNRAVGLNRRHTMQVTGHDRSTWGLGNNSLLDPPPNDSTRRVRVQSPDQNIDPGRGSTALGGTNGTDVALPRWGESIIPTPLSDDEDESPRSETTWGTVPSASLTGHSLSDLGMLLGLHNGGVRGQGSVGSSSMVGRDVNGNIPTSESRVGNEPDGESGTPTLSGSFSAASIGTSALGLITEDEGDHVRSGTSEAVRPHRRVVSYTATTTQVTQAEHDYSSRHASRTERTRDRRRHASQPTSAEILPTQGSGNMTNALSLTFDASPPPHDTYNVSVPSTYSGVGREIIAPTPVFGGPNIIHLWGNRA
ncbi:hypothetical protein V8B97DRAFT_668194 [Scleroderma yunnanense]